MRGRPKKEIAVIHNALARAKNDLPPLGMRIMVLLATRVQHDQDLLKHKLRVKEYKEHLGITGGSAYHTLERTADQMLRSLVEVQDYIEGSRTKFQILSRAKYYDQEGAIELQFHEDIRPFLVGLKEHFTKVPADVFADYAVGTPCKCTCVCGLGILMTAAINIQTDAGILKTFDGPSASTVTNT